MSLKWKQKKKDKRKEKQRKDRKNYPGLEKSYAHNLLFTNQ